MSACVNVCENFMMGCPCVILITLPNRFELLLWHKLFDSVKNDLQLKLTAVSCWLVDLKWSEHLCKCVCCCDLFALSARMQPVCVCVVVVLRILRSLFLPVNRVHFSPCLGLHKFVFMWMSVFFQSPLLWYLELLKFQGCDIQVPHEKTRRVRFVNPALFFRGKPIF